MLTLVFETKNFIIKGLQLETHRVKESVRSRVRRRRGDHGERRGRPRDTERDLCIQFMSYKFPFNARGFHLIFLCIKSSF